MKKWGTAKLGGVIAVAVALIGGPLLLHTPDARANSPAWNTSTIWSGYVGEEGAPIDGAEGTWTVPTVQPTEAEFLGSGTWVGVDGYTGNGYLIQTGTIQDSSSQGTVYSAFWEIFDGPAGGSGVVAINEPVAPGDVIVADVHKVLADQDWWQIDLSDTTAGWSFDSQTSYSGPGATDEWVEEAYGGPGVTANWGTVHFSGMETYTPGGTWAPSALTDSDAVDLVDTNLNVIAAPGPITSSPSGQSFDDTFGTPASPPPPTSGTSATTGTTPTVPPSTSPPTTAPPAATTSSTSTTTTTVPHRPPPPKHPKPPRPLPPTWVGATPERRAIRVRWAARSQAVGYLVREYRDGQLIRSWPAKTTAVTVRGLNWRDRYSYAVATVSPSGVSVWSARTRPVKPRR